MRSPIGFLILLYCEDFPDYKPQYPRRITNKPSPIIWMEEGFCEVAE
jgi:hypothetical protein